MTPQDEDIILRAAKSLIEEGAKEVYVFGSRASGEAHDESDLDLAVSGLPRGRYFKALSRAWDAAGMPIDLVDLDDDNPFTQHLRKWRKLRRVA